MELRGVFLRCYDLTTLRFESTRTDLGRLRQFGYSKEMRTDMYAGGVWFAGGHRGSSSGI